jgi:hypothetical protein
MQFDPVLVVLVPAKSLFLAFDSKYTIPYHLQKSDL